MKKYKSNNKFIVEIKNSSKLCCGIYKIEINSNKKYCYIFLDVTFNTTKFDTYFSDNPDMEFTIDDIKSYFIPLNTLLKVVSIKPI